MGTQTVALIILIATIVLFAIDKFPLALVSVASVLAMVLTGTLPFADAFKGFASNLVMLVVGMLIIGSALFENGVVQAVGDLLFRRFEHSERALLIAVMIASAVLSGFLHNVSVMAMMLPLVSAYVQRSEGRLHTKTFFMALSHATILGARFTLVGSSPPMLAQNVLLTTEGVERGFGFFELAMVAVPVFIVALICYYFFIYRLGVKVFDQTNEPELSYATPRTDVKRWKRWFSGIVMLAVAAGFVFIKTIPLGAVSLTGACLLVFTGCVNGKESMRRLDWPTIIILGCSTGIAGCFNLTGLGDMAVNALTRIGASESSELLLIIIFTFSAAIISNLMSNSSVTIIFSSLAVSVALGLGVDPIPMVAAVVFGGGCAFTLPTSTSTLTMSAAAGYAFKDYALIGTILSVICCTVSAFMIALVYGVL